MKTVIMAGGMGKRIQSVRSDVPKPMIEISGKPILLYQIENLKACGLKDITLVIGHLGNVIKEYFGDGSKFGVKISYFEEKSPLGTAGALVKMLPENSDISFCPTVLSEDFLLLCGDVIFDIDFNRFIEFHKSKKALATLLSHPNGHPYDSSLLVTETLPPKEKGANPVETNKVVSWLSKEDERKYYRNLVNAGLEIISPELLRLTMKNFVPRHPETPEKIDLDRDILKPNIKTGKIFSYKSPEYIKDMGTPDRYLETENDIKSGKVHSRNLSQKQKAIFLDRDGTINTENGFITKPEQFSLLPGVCEAIKKINKKLYPKFNSFVGRRKMINIVSTVDTTHIMVSVLSDFLNMFAEKRIFILKAQEIMKKEQLNENNNGYVDLETLKAQVIADVTKIYKDNGII